MLNHQSVLEVWNEEKNKKIFFDPENWTKGYYSETGWRFSIEIPFCKCAPLPLNVSFQYTFRNAMSEIGKNENRLKNIPL